VDAIVDRVVTRSPPDGPWPTAPKRTFTEKEIVLV